MAVMETTQTVEGLRVNPWVQSSRPELSKRDPERRAAELTRLGLQRPRIYFRGQFEHHQQWQQDLLVSDQLAAQFSALRAYRYAKQLKTDVGRQGVDLSADLVFTPDTANLILGNALRQHDLPLTFNLLYDIAGRGQGLPTSSCLNRIVYETSQQAQLYRRFTTAAGAIVDPIDTLGQVTEFYNQASESKSPDDVQAALFDTPLPLSPEPDSSKARALPAKVRPNDVHPPDGPRLQPIVLPDFLLRRCYYLFDQITKPNRLDSKSADPSSAARLPTPSPVQVPSHRKQAAPRLTNAATQPPLTSAEETALFTDLFVNLHPATLPDTFITRLLTDPPLSRFTALLRSVFSRAPFEIPPPVLTLGIATLVKANRVGTANNAYGLLFRSFYDPDGVKPNARLRLQPAYLKFITQYPYLAFPFTRAASNALIQGWLATRRPALAFEYLKRMVDMGIDPGVDTWNIFLADLFRRGFQADTIQLWRHFEQAAEAIAEGRAPDSAPYQSNQPGYAGLVHLGPVPPPSAETYQVFLRGFGGTGNIVEMLNVYHSLVRDSAVEPTRQHYSTVLIYLNRHGDPEHVLRTLPTIARGLQVDRIRPQFMRHPGVVPTDVNDDPPAVMSDISRGADPIGRPEAPAVTGSTTAELFYPTTAVFNDLLRKLESGHEPGLALKVFNELRGAHRHEPTIAGPRSNSPDLCASLPTAVPDQPSMTTAAGGPVRSDIPASGPEIAATAQSGTAAGTTTHLPYRATSTTSSGRSPNIVTYNVLIRVFLDRGEDQRALRMLEYLKTGPVHPDPVTFTLLIGSALRNGHLGQALTLFGDMTTRLHLQPTVATLNALIRYYMLAAHEACHPDDALPKASQHPDLESATLPLAPPAAPTAHERYYCAAWAVFDAFTTYEQDPDHQTLQILLAGCLLNHRLEHIDRCLDYLEASQIFVAGPTMEEAFTTCLRKFELYTARRIYDQFTSYTHQTPSSLMLETARMYEFID
ncbi:hypothetical protein IWQ60_005671 [Tieghemiomyces parasiticus]|uniref:Pentacotripeptide-repeat region of PRORP domain-containing protein n=1 Tax=Tieghemiomyces parasiticus TaxID=78921 RepID=A0A9W8DYN7_9FUNG|nr:hypothetical protein IWQ60_005671 [Tieghemiomyces parasiticus]